MVSIPVSSFSHLNPKAFWGGGGSMEDSNRESNKATNVSASHASSDWHIIGSHQTLQVKARARRHLLLLSKIATLPRRSKQRNSYISLADVMEKASRSILHKDSQASLCSNKPDSQPTA
jgi:hypothetical protein